MQAPDHIRSQAKLDWIKSNILRLINAINLNQYILDNFKDLNDEMKITLKCQQEMYKNDLSRFYDMQKGALSELSN